MANELNATLPLLSSTSAIVASNSLTLKAISASGQFLPFMVDIGTLPLFTASASGASSGCRVDATLSLLELDGQSESVNGSAREVLPLFEIETSLGGNAINQLPDFGMTGIGHVGGLNVNGDQEASLPKIEISAHATIPLAAEAELSLPKIRLAGTTRQSVVISASLTLPRFTVDIVAKTGGKGTGLNILPFKTLISTGKQDTRGDASLTLPLPELLSDILNGVFSAVVMNTATSAVSEYTGFTFNSFCKFDGSYLAAGVNGIVCLGGETDLTGQISASFKTGTTNFGTLRVKRVHDVYLFGRISGKMDVILTTEEQDSHTYRSFGNLGDVRLKTERIKTGKGAKSAAWDVELKNVVGADFDMEQAELHSIVTTRKVG